LGGGAREPVVLVIPASLASRRLPRKMLLAETGKPLVLHTLERARATRGVDRVIVATDSDEVARVVDGAGGEAFRNSLPARTGTDRMAEVAQELDAPYFIDLQGDEPEIDPGDLDRVAASLRDDTGEIVTLAQRVRSRQELEDPNVVKVVFTRARRALYFSRSPVPHSREAKGDTGPPLAWKHVGVYGYPRDRLLEFRELGPSRLEQEEGLEQLRALEQGWPVRVLTSEGDTPGINSREDYDRFVASQTGRREEVEKCP